MYVELVLYNGLVTGSIEVSDVGPTGPWTTFTLSEPTPLIDAVEVWRAAADAALSGTYTWDVDMDDPAHPKVRFTGSGHWVRVGECLRELLGFDPSPVPPETGYIQGDGTGWIRIPGALSGYGTTYAVVTKWERLPTSYASWPALTTLSNPAATVSASLHNVTDYLHVQATGPQYRFRGLTLSATQNYAATGTGGVTSGRQVHSMTRTGVGGPTRAAKARVFDAAGTAWFSASQTPTADNNPADIHLLAFAKADNVLVSPPAPSDARLVAVVVLHREPTDAELQTYAAADCYDAEEVWGGDIKGYWTAADIAGSSWPARIGSVAGVMMAGLNETDFTQTYNPSVLAAGASSDQSPSGLLRAPGVARTQPLDKAVTQLTEYRGGRASSYTYGRAKEVRLELYLSADETEVLTQTPLGSGHGALRVTIEDNTEAYDVDDLDGRIVCYPYTTQTIDGDESGGDWTQVVILATMEDPS